MDSRWLILLLFVGLLFAPAGAAQGQGDPQGGPPGQEGHPHGGPPGQDGNGSAEGDGGNSSGNNTQEAAATTAMRGCRAVEWDGGDVELDDDPLLGVLVIDVFRCLSSAERMDEGPGVTPW